VLYAEKNGYEKHTMTKQSPQRPVRKGQLKWEQSRGRASSRKHSWGLSGYTLQSKRRRVESAREAEMERGKLGAGCQVLCKSANLSGVTSAERPAQQLTKGTNLRTASFSLCLRDQTEQTCRKGQI